MWLTPSRHHCILMHGMHRGHAFKIMVQAMHAQTVVIYCQTAAWQFWCVNTETGQGSIDDFSATCSSKVSKVHCLTAHAQEPPYLAHATICTTPRPMRDMTLKKIAAALSHRPAKNSTTCKAPTAVQRLTPTLELNQPQLKFQTF